jgi:acyl-CoA thioesterase II
MSLSITDVPETLRIDRVDEDRFEVPAGEGDAARDVVNGVQLMAHGMVASALGRDTDHTVKSAHGVFAKPAARSAPIEIELDRFYAGRAFSMDTITVRQRDKNCARIQLLLHAEEDDLIRHGDDMPPVPGPDESPEFLASAVAVPGIEMRIVDGVDYVSVDHELRPPETFIWMRSAEPVVNPVMAQATLCASTGTMLIGTAFLPHPDIGQAQAHRTISTGVVGHTAHFHEPFDLGDWLLLAQESVYAGRGRTHGRARVFDLRGNLVATYSQDSMIRHFTDRRDHSAEARTIM